jgi:mannitol PTS system EIIA component
MALEILAPSSVRIAPTAVDRDTAIREAGAILVESGAVDAAYVDSMLEREGSVSTFMGNYLAIPHGTNEGKDLIHRSAMSLVRYPADIDWSGEPTRFVVAIAGLGDEHLELLSGLAVAFSDEDVVQQLLDAPDADALHALLLSVEA